MIRRMSWPPGREAVVAEQACALLCLGLLSATLMTVLTIAVKLTA